MSKETRNESLKLAINGAYTPLTVKIRKD